MTFCDDEELLEILGDPEAGLQMEPDPELERIMSPDPAAVGAALREALARTPQPWPPGWVD